MDDARGAEILTGGTGSADRAGWFCAPTVVAALTRHAAVGGGGFRSGGVLYLVASLDEAFGARQQRRVRPGLGVLEL